MRTMIIITILMIQVNTARVVVRVQVNFIHAPAVLTPEKEPPGTHCIGDRFAARHKDNNIMEIAEIYGKLKYHIPYTSNTSSHNMWLLQPINELFLGYYLQIPFGKNAQEMHT